MTANRTLLTIAGTLSALLLASYVAVDAQQPRATQPPTAAKPGQFEFDVIESFDAKYAGDTPGHRGKAGGLLGVKLNIALGDAVYRGTAKVGTVTSLTWSSVNGVLEVEFDPEAQRISIGERLWIALDGSAGEKR